MFNENISENYIDEYSVLHGEAHKRSAFAVGAPALSWHLGLFATNENNPKNIFEVIDHREMAQIAKQFFFSILDGIDVGPDYERIRDAAYESANASGPKVLFLSINDILLKVAVTPHSDHFTLTIVVDLSKPAHLNIPTSNDIPQDTVMKIEVINNDFSELILRHYANYAKYADGDNTTSETVATEAKYFLQNGIWEKIASQFLKNTMLHDPKKSRTKECYRHKIFADFRGVLINSQKIRDVLKINRGHEDAGLVGNNGLFIEKHSQTIGLKSVFPLFKLGDRTFNYKEIIGCTLFRNRAVYMSPLGAPPVHSGAIIDNCRPLYFAVAVHENNRWQIGRIIHRLNTLGTLRLLALRDFKKLKDASDSIREVGEALDLAARQTDDANHTTEGRIDAEHNRLVQHKKKIDSIGLNIAGHISYRVYRSRYRAQQFDIQLSDLHVERIEAWQPYDEFVKRRLYPAFDFISRIGERYERLNENYQRQLLSLNSEMQSTSGQHLVHIQDEVLESHAFQHIIESIALGYYGGLVTFYISKPYYIDLLNFIVDVLNNIILIISLFINKYMENDINYLILSHYECGDTPNYCQMDKYWQSFCFIVFVFWAAVRFFGNQLQDKRNKRQLLIKRLGLKKAVSDKKSQLRFSSVFFSVLDKFIKESGKYDTYNRKDVKRLELTRDANDDH